MDRSEQLGGYIPERDIFRTRKSSSHRLKTRSRPRTNARSARSRQRSRTRSVRSRQRYSTRSARSKLSNRRTKRGGRTSYQKIIDALFNKKVAVIVAQNSDMHDKKFNYGISQRVHTDDQDNDIHQIKETTLKRIKHALRKQLQKINYSISNKFKRSKKTRKSEDEDEDEEDLFEENYYDVEDMAFDFGKGNNFFTGIVNGGIPVHGFFTDSPGGEPIRELVRPEIKNIEINNMDNYSENNSNSDGYTDNDYDSSNSSKSSKHGGKK
jgi:hypothetical protein